MDKLNNTFTDCSCISTDPYVEIELGACAKDCTSTLIPYLVVIFVITMVTCCAQTPAIFVTLRCVNEDERPIAMGCQYLLLRLIAYIPTPMYFGRMIDSACMIWDGSTGQCDENKGACAVYSPSKFRHIYFGLAACIKLFAIFGSLTLCRLMIVRRNNARRTQSEDEPGVTPSLTLSPETSGGGTTVST